MVVWSDSVGVHDKFRRVFCKYAFYLAAILVSSKKKSITLEDHNL